jgi:hypothetical protein
VPLLFCVTIRSHTAATGETALQIAIRRWRLDVARALIYAGAVVDENMQEPLCCDKQDFPAVREFLQVSKTSRDVGRIVTIDNMNSIRKAIERNDKSLIKRILDKQLWTLGWFAMVSAMVFQKNDLELANIVLKRFPLAYYPDNLIAAVSCMESTTVEEDPQYLALITGILRQNTCPTSTPALQAANAAICRAVLLACNYGKSAPLDLLLTHLEIPKAGVLAPWESRGLMASSQNEDYTGDDEAVGDIEWGEFLNDFS